VSGYVYKFDLVLSHEPANPDSCEKSASNPERCHMEVYNVPWEKTTEVQWDKVDCVGKPSE
jgi:hypothetical protein